MSTRDWRLLLNERDAEGVANVEDRKKRGFSLYGHEKLCSLLIDILDNYGKLDVEPDSVGKREKPVRSHRATSGSL